MRIRFLLFTALAAHTFTRFRSPAVSAHRGRSFFTPASHTSHGRDVSVPPPSPAHVVLHQHHAPRALLDVCAHIDLDVLENLHLDLFGLPWSALLDLDICLCLSLLPLVLTTDVQLEALVPLIGINNLTSILTAAVSSHGCC